LKTIPLTGASMLLATALLFASPISGQDGGAGATAPVPNGSSPSHRVPQGADYFPAATVDGYANFFAAYLDHWGEPSFLAAAKDPNLVSYRADFWSGQMGYLFAVRLTMNPDGTAQLTTTIESGKGAIQKSQSNVSAEDAQHFLRLVDGSGYWTLPSGEERKPNGIVLDASVWVFEGVRQGSEHVVSLPRIGPSRLAGSVSFLVKTLAHIPDSVASIPE
jgi:hypothetical protein